LSISVFERRRIIARIFSFHKPSFRLFVAGSGNAAANFETARPSVSVADL
jgi:hypothetical protein